MNPYALLDPAVLALHTLLGAIASTVPAPEGVRYAVALALVTIAVRALLLPLSVRSMRMERRRVALTPALAALRRRHAHDPRRLLTETARVRREAGVSTGNALLLAVVQLPVIAAVYRLVVVPTVAGSPNLLLSAHLFGAPMAAHWPEVLAAGGLLGPGTLALVALLAALTLLAVASVRESARRAEQARAAGAVDETAATVERAVRLLPFGTVLFALVAPVAMGVYLLTTTAWTVTERRLLPRLLPS